MKKTILCVGGDNRMTYCAKALAESAKVFTYGITDDASGTAVLPCLSEKADMLVLGIIRTDSRDIAVFRDKKVSCEKLSPLLKKNAVVIGGNLSRTLIEYFSSQGFEVRDYFKREELILRNTVPTAEGTLEIALRETDSTVNGSRVLIVGSGRVAAACAKLFFAVGAVTDISARNRKALAELELEGFGTMPLCKLSDRINGYDIIINTVPALVIKKEQLENCRSNALLIDLASMPGGVDFEAARELGVRCIHALGLPGKCAPVTAGEIIARTAKEILEEVSEGS